MRTTAGVIVDEEASQIDAVTVRFDLFGNMFVEQGLGDCVAFTPTMQDQLVDAIVAQRKTAGGQPQRFLSSNVVSLGMAMSLTMAIVGPYSYCWKSKYPATKTTQTVHAQVYDDRKGSA